MSGRFAYQRRAPASRANVSVGAYCAHCSHVAELDLETMIRAGHDESPLLGLPLQFEQCPEFGHTVVVRAPSGTGR
ncbi:MAG: hypothetical protein JOZ17_23540 [Acetobacteraceae bacterium]|nr:hypothetical protein [Acetobacteraceae bacterium]